MRPGAKNLITDVPGVLIGNAENHAMKTGVTVLTAEAPFGAAVHVMGGAPGTRETDLLAPENLVDRVDAIVLAGGSAMGLEAASGVADQLQSQGRGVPVYGKVVPIVPAAIILDYRAQGEDGPAPWRGLGEAALAAAASDFAIGTAGAGTGATTADLKGGLGSASAEVLDGVTVGAIAVANPIGSVLAAGGPEFLAAPFEGGTEFGGKGPAMSRPDWLPTKVEQGATVIGAVATDAALSKAQLKRLAVMAHDGIARAVLPSHTPFDGDCIFAVSTRARELPDADLALIQLGHAAATCMTRAMARAVYEARPAPGDPYPTWRERFEE